MGFDWGLTGFGWGSEGVWTGFGRGSGRVQTGFGQGLDRVWGLARVYLTMKPIVIIRVHLGFIWSTSGVHLGFVWGSSGVHKGVHLRFIRGSSGVHPKSESQ